MPQYCPPPDPHHLTPPPFVRTASDRCSYEQTQIASAACSEDCKPGAESERSVEHLSSVSNRFNRGNIKVVFVNGISTLPSEADSTCKYTCDSLGISRDKVKLLYNRDEGSTCIGLVKVIGGAISSRIGAEMEEECIAGLREEIRRVILGDSERLLVVGHSQGSLIFQNAVDTMHDELARSKSGQQLWKSATPRIEAIFYAPIVGHTSPGIEFVGFSSEADFPARSASRLSQIVNAGKNVFCWRPYKPIKSVMMPIAVNDLNSLFIDPLHGHRLVHLLLNDASFHLLHFGTDSDGEFVPELLAARLAYSIRHGLRSDHTHRQIIMLSTEKIGPVFSKQFLRRVKVLNGVGWIELFKIDTRDLNILIESSSQLETCE